MAFCDRIYHSFLVSVKFFSKGWGPVETYESLAKYVPAFLDRATFEKAVSEHTHPIRTRKVAESRDVVLVDGSFFSPLTTLMPGVLPEEAKVARFQLVLPRQWKNHHRPMYIQFAGTGDHFFWRRRRLLALPLLKSAGIGSLLLENPFYGYRKPRMQRRSQLLHVSDLFVMGLSLILESMVLLHWMEDQGLGPVGLTGFSMGGHNASLSASLWPKPAPVVPCLSWSTASSVFTEGTLSSSVCWNVLEEQLFYSKLGHDISRRKLFEEVSRRYRKIDPSSLDIGTMDKPSLASTQHKVSNSGQQRNEEKRSLQGINEGQKSSPSPETVRMLRWVLDNATHLNNYPVPHCPELVLFLAARGDSYVPRENISDVSVLWPGCSVRYVNGGHISTYLLQREAMRRAMADAMGHMLCTQPSQTLA